MLFTSSTQSSLAFKQTILKEYGLAIGFTGIAILARLLLDPFLGDHLPYVTFFTAVAVTIWCCSLGPSLAAVFLGGIASNWFFIPPRHSLLLDGVMNHVGHATFFMVSLSIVGFGQAWRLARERAEIAIADLRREASERAQAEQSLREAQERLQRWNVELEKAVNAKTTDLMQSHERLRALASELNLAEQRERKRLAAELHDHLQQILVLGKLKLGQGRRYAESIPECAKAIHETQEVLSDALKYTRTLVAELSPPVLHAHGLGAGLKWLAESMKKLDLVVTVSVPEGNGPKLPEDQTVLLFQSVRELLINSWKHAGTHQASVTLEEHDGQLKIEVKDLGAGFDLGVAAAAETHSETTEGISSKFGLFSVCERMIALAGSFEVKTAPGQGTTATLTLPLPASQGRDTERETKGGTLQSDLSASLPPRQLPPMSARIRVLLVDDHAMVRQGLRSILASNINIEVVAEAANGVEALHSVEQHRPRVVIMDINMPEMNGIEATARITANFPGIHVIGLSVNADDDNREAMRKAGATILLTKESAVEHLYEAIQSAMKRNDGVPRVPVTDEANPDRWLAPS